ncbi:hypothetical protein [Fusobacterium periodonticum]|uniref:Uncharacterized protein n=1 Tax=Fusobacterium periodonticum 1_1_41FAA TaxID=469621 RepID=D6LF25_9FUSO|nr:hypothetical protein [Fusobacterium periodonticum]EFG28760.1 hypothetical protein HMPREF0400_00313 [Fusobacterium periodonticum 1_1_41FAA]
MSEDKKLKEEFCVYFNISSNLEEEKLLHRYEMFIRDIKRTLKDNNFNEYELNLEANNISINILNNTLKEIANILKCLADIQIMAIEKYKFLLKGVVEYNKKDLADSFEEKEFNYPLIMLGDSIKKTNKAIVEDFSQSLIKIFDEYYIDYLSVYYENNNEDDFFNIMLKHKKFIKERLKENSKEFYKATSISGKRILEEQFFYEEPKILEKISQYKVLYNKERDDKYINAVLEFEKEFPNFKENGEKLLKIREKYLYLLNYHKKIVFSLIKFGVYKEDRRSKCSINLEEII